MKNYRIAAIIMIVHGALMEIGGCLALIPALLSPDADIDIGRYFSFIVPYLQENLYLMAVIGGIYGTIRVIGAVGLLRNRLWGVALSTINCVLTLALMVFMLPAGIVDGVLAGSALVLILMWYFGKSRAVVSE